MEEFPKQKHTKEREIRNGVWVEAEMVNGTY